ncbi:hypothetical protein O7599_23725 [Streptomyces sp. WMMC500]|uniref:putative T7SS-secreted protein n=1 Tax=Streptomyces sp. WMMC500 TaxID=3015154 RepID=UPI00248A8FCA|nr:hypothetical protein [Streptomyces sp. WMMC500]WBB58623.1 hypothetical protein O7599_23725 [Streptomyces sp. WMMC500]
MGRRPAAHRWAVLGEDSDPVPGSPDEVAQLGRELRRTADTIQRQADEIKALASVENWKGKAANAFRDAADDAEGKLRKAFRRYDVAAEALGESVQPGVCSNEYASELRRAQDQADKALSDAEQADGDKAAAKKALDGQPEDTPKDDPETRKQESRADDADAALARAKRDLEEAKGVRDRAAKKAADAIRDVIDNDGLKDSRWDKFKNWVSENSGWIKEISKWAGRLAAALGVLSLVVNCIPVIGQALSAVFAALALVAGIVSLAANLTLALAGEGSWLDVALDVVGIATFGIGRAAIAGARGAAAGAKAFSRTSLYQAARASGKGVNKSWKIANAGSGSARGSAHAAAVAGMPASRLQGVKGILEGFNPKAIVKETWDAGKAVVKPGKFDVPDMGAVGRSLEGIAPAALKNADVANATRMFTEQMKIFNVANVTGVSVAVSNTDVVDAWGRFTPLKDMTTAPVGG